MGLFEATGELLRRCLAKDYQAGFLLTRRVGRLLCPPYRFIDPRIEWWSNERFADFLRRFEEYDALNCDRKWMVYQLARLTSAVPGDTAECGAYRGASSWLICAATQDGVRTHYVCDSFAGLSSPGPNDGSHWRPGDLACSEDIVAGNLSDYKRVVLLKGWIPSRFVDIARRRFAFVHIDVDLEQPTAESIAFFYPRMSAGGILLCDDYGFETCPGATSAINRYLHPLPEHMIKLPGGGGFMIKGTTTAHDLFD